MEKEEYYEKKKKEISIALLYKQILIEEIQVLYDYCKTLENMEMFDKCIIKNNPYVVRTWTGFEVLLPRDV